MSDPAPRPIPHTGLVDTLAINLCHALPAVFQGLFKRSQFFSGLLEILHIRPYNSRWGQRLRRRYASDYVYTSVLFQPSLLVFDPAGIRRVLENSPSIYGEASTKVTGMSHWQPDSATVSEGNEWQQRRRFNESVLETDSLLHSLAPAFARAAHSALEEVPPFNWNTISRIHVALTQRVVFGAATPANKQTVRTQWKLMTRANIPIGLKPNRHFAELIGATRQATQHPLPDSLAARCPHAPSSPQTSAELQMPHWLFAISATLPENIIRVLWLIASHPVVDQKVRAELRGKDLMDPTAIAELHYLRGCIQEAMRLYPTTTLIARRMRRRDTLADEVVAADTQILIPNPAVHRDSSALDDADRFVPERWLEHQSGGGDDYRFNHFGNGAKRCAGRELVLFLASAMVAAMLQRHSFTVKRPRIKPGQPLPNSNNPFRIAFTLNDNS